MTEFPNKKPISKRRKMLKQTKKIDLVNLNTFEDKKNSFSYDVLIGLSKEQKSIPSIYFYDKKGSEIFEKICDLEEYYQTRTEAGILKLYAETIADNTLEDVDIIELGSGSSEKTKILLEAFIAKNNFVDYYPIDISDKFLLKTAQKLSENYPQLYIYPIAGRYDEGLEYIFSKKTDSPKLVLWLGSSIGNLNQSESIAFLSNLSRLFRKDDRLLIGMDLKKDTIILEKAYNDSLDVTADFNLNLLTRINNELGGEFDLNDFEHRAVYNQDKGRIEMHLVSKIHQNIFIKALNKTFEFKKGEYIHTENSHKYNKGDIDELAQKSGFIVSNHWTDNDKLFSLNEFKIK